MTEPRREIELLGTLGCGGFGTVYLANLHGRDGFVRRVAVKVLKQGLESQPQILARQRDEARLLGRLAHDNIVQVIDLMEVGGRPAVVMEYVEGVDLNALLDAGEPLPPRAALEIVAATAAALDAAWNAPDPRTGQPLHVIHRDIKPPNLFLTPNGALKVLDFGIARADFDREGNTTAVSYGTPRFMAPEQWLQEPFGAPVDVYALGVVLVELLAHHGWERPPLARSAFDAHLEAALNRLDAAEGVRELARGMLAYEPAERPSARDLHARATDLAEAASGEGLARYARRVVPPLVEVRRAALAAEPRPTFEPTPREVSSETLGTRFPSSDPVPPWGLRLAGMAVGLVATAFAAFVIVVGASFVLDRDAVEIAAPEAPAVAPPVVEPAEVAPAIAVAEPVVPPPAAPSTARGRRAASEPVAAAATEPVETDAPVRILAPAVRTPAAPQATPEPAPAPVTPAAAPAATWDLQVTTDPMGAEVWVDGARIGLTPDAHVRLPAGTHVVVVVQGGKRAERDVVVGPETPRGIRYYFTTGTWRTIR